MKTRFTFIIIICLFSLFLCAQPKPTITTSTRKLGRHQLINATEMEFSKTDKWSTLSYLDLNVLSYTIVLWQCSFTAFRIAKKNLMGVLWNFTPT